MALFVRFFTQKVTVAEGQIEGACYVIFLLS
jgi:hypothetical protein